MKARLVNGKAHFGHVIVPVDAKNRPVAFIKVRRPVLTPRTEYRIEGGAV